MKVLGIIFFLIGITGLILAALSFEFAIYSLLFSTLSVCGTLMAIFCKKIAGQVKTCEYCLEESDSKVKKCKHCGEMFSE